MCPLGDALEEKLIAISAKICDSDCLQCENAKVARLEARVRLFQQNKINSAVYNPEEQFYDAQEYDSHTFSAKRCRGTFNRRIYDFKTEYGGKGYARDGNEDSFYVGLKRRVGFEVFYSPNGTDDLSRLKRRFEEGKTNKIRKVLLPSDLKMSEKGSLRLYMMKYRWLICDVDIATLNAYKCCFDVDTTRKRVIERNLNTKGEKKTLEGESQQKPLESAKGFMPQEILGDSPKDTKGLSEESGGGSSDVNRELEKQNSERELSEAPRNPESSILGAKTLELLNSKLNAPTIQGNPIFAPNTVDLGVFGKSKSAPNFVFGQTVPESATNKSVDNMAMDQSINKVTSFQEFPKPDLSTRVQFAIPGFGEASVASTSSGVNPFSGTFPKARRGRLRGARNR